MTNLKNTSWQQRYDATRILTLRYKMPDEPEMTGRLISAVGRAGAYTGQVKTADVQDRYKFSDITVYLKDNEQLEKVIEATGEIDGVELISVTDDILQMHSRGSIEVISRLPIRTVADLRMLYTPGVASVCEKIKQQPQTAWEFTGICDRVAIVTNGTAVLGLGNVGPLASLPVMEGKSAIFAEFAAISGIPVLIDSEDVDVFVETVVRIAKGFGAIQLEDVAAPACFEIEEKLKEKLRIPVFHDDQHGTATVVLAALINALKKTGKKSHNCSVIMLGAGAAGDAISRILLDFGIGDVVVYDSAGPLYCGRKEKMNPYKEKLAAITNKNNQKTVLAEGFAGKDIFIGVSRPGTVSKEMISSMAAEPIVFPLANPAGEITKQQARQAGAAIAADGRDINNALAYPGIFRGALDAQATEITAEMKLAAAEKLACLAPADALLADMLDRQVHKETARAVAEAWQSRQGRSSQKQNT